MAYIFSMSKQLHAGEEIRILVSRGLWYMRDMINKWERKIQQARGRVPIRELAGSLGAYSTILTIILYRNYMCKLVSIFCSYIAVVRWSIQGSCCVCDNDRTKIVFNYQSYT